MFDKAKDIYKARKQMKQMERDLKNTHIEAEHEGVTIIVSGNQEVIEVKISEEAKNDKHLEKNLLNAFNKALKKAKSIQEEMAKSAMGNIDLKGLLGG